MYVAQIYSMDYGAGDWSVHFSQMLRGVAYSILIHVSTMKILVCGDVNGNFKTLLARVETVLKKNAGFTMLMCTGSFFANNDTCNEQWKSIKDGSIQIPVPILILGPQSEDVRKFYEGVPADGGEITRDITCLGQRGVYTTTNGLQVGYLSGHYDQSKYSQSVNNEKDLTPYFNQSDINSLTKYTEGDEFKGVDVLLTAEWPQNITDTIEGVNTANIGSISVSQIAFKLKPRYHFTSKMTVFYERVPYRNHEVLSGEQEHVTRFIALANVGNSDKKKRYLYAFTIEPLRNMDRRELVQQPQSVTANPFIDITARYKTGSSHHHHTSNSGDGGSDSVMSANYFFDAKAIAAGKKRQQREQDRLLQQLDPSSKPSKHHKPPQPKGPCWFCLGSAEIEKHLIVSIGEYSYTAIPKGSLVNDHILIIPIGHYASLVDTPKEVYDEIVKFKNALRQYYTSRNVSCVMFERNYRSQHLQIQVVPVPKCESGALRQAFKEHGKLNKLEFMEIPRDVDLSQVLQGGAAYFAADFDDGPSLLVRITGFFSLQFGREVLASPLILNVPKRINWKSCAMTRHQETSAADTYRENFKQFDFTLEDEDD